MELSPQDAIAKYSLPLETPVMDAEALKASSYVLIRHGLSQYNYKALVTKTEFGEGSPEFRAVETAEGGEDPELHPVGIL